MNTHLTHFKLPGDSVPSVIDLTAEGLCRGGDPTPGAVVLLQIVVGALLMLGIALIGMA